MFSDNGSKIIERTIEDTDEPNRNDTVYQIMHDAFHEATLWDSAIWRGGMTDETMEKLLQWFYSLDERFGFEPATIFWYYRWASKVRSIQGKNVQSPSRVGFSHGDIVHNGKKIHTNFVVFTFKDGSFVNIPIEEPFDHSD